MIVKLPSGEFHQAPEPKNSRIEFVSIAPMLADVIRDLMEGPRSLETPSRRGVLV